MIKMDMLLISDIVRPYFYELKHAYCEYFYAKYVVMAKKKNVEKIRINRLKVVLADKEMSHKDLAKKLKKAPNTITRICNNESQPSLKFLREIALVLDVDIRELIHPTKE